MNKKIVLGFVVVVVFSFVFLKLASNSQIPASRLWMEYAMEIVKEKKPAPTESAWFYATVATIYSEGIENGKGTQKEKEQYANLRTGKFINFIHLEKAASTTDFLSKNNLLIMDYKNDDLLKEDLGKYLDLYEYNKNIKEKWRPVGNKYNEYWFADQKPFTPTAGEWLRWNLGVGENRFDYKVPTPPKYGSPEYIEKLKEVKLAADLRTSEQGALINFWGGVPGTEQPAGIWQNRLWDEVKNQKKFFIFPKYGNQEYAKIQMYLAQSVSDSFMECWKVKYEYNTKRPSMAADVFEKQIGGKINLAMPNPPFPSYTSGHSTISATAATVLCELIKDKCEIWRKNALDAKNSRLWAGIHFAYDNDEGEELGNAIGQYYVANFLQRVSP